MSGMFRGIGRRLMGALSVTGGFKTHEALAISSKLESVERELRDAAPVNEAAGMPYKPNRAQRRANTKAKRHRCSRAVAFHAKRHNPYHPDGIHYAQARLTHDRVSNKGIHFIYNPKLNGLLYASGALGDAPEVQA